MTTAERADADFHQRLVAFRRDMHEHPELAFEETRTADAISRELDRLGITHERGVATTGIVADIPGGGRNAGPKVALRADIDALPIQEETGLAFASVHDGVMHACGHDGHTTMVLGACELLARDDDLPAPVRILFQPAEERGTGAKAMIEAGALDGVAMIFGGHVDRLYPTGTIVTHAGAVNASSDRFSIEIRGPGGHAARPHESIDTIVAGAQLVSALQSVISRELDPADPAVLTIGRFHAGTAPNVIARNAILEGTIRAQDPEVREHIIAAIRRISEATASATRAEVEVNIQVGVPAVVNTPEMAALAREAAAAIVGAERAVALDTANMGGEDFAHYLRHVKGCYVRIGVARGDRINHAAHSSKFDIDEAVLPIGARFFHHLAKLAGRSLEAG